MKKEIKESKYELAKKLLGEKSDISFIAKVTDLSVEEIENL